MKKSILTLSLCLIVVIMISQTTKTFKNYSLDIPTSWKSSSNYELSEFSKASNQTIDVLLYPDYKKEYNGPPIIFSSFKSGSLSPSDYEAKAMDILQVYKTKMMDAVPKDLLSDYKILKPGQGYYYKKSSAFCFMYESKFKPLELYNMVTGYFTTKGIIMVLFTDTKTNFNNTLSGYLKCLSSIKK